MLGYLDIVSSISHLMLKGVTTSVVLLFDFNSLRNTTVLIAITIVI